MAKAASSPARSGGFRLALLWLIGVPIPVILLLWLFLGH